MIDFSALKNDEKAVFTLRSLYEKYGYSQYKMSKFEEYDLYVRNKDFLVSDNIITFTDTNGKLMALKPDVTLSIIKNSDDRKSSLDKVYYNENVYRVSKGTHSYKEIMQVGLECIGDIDDYCIYEVLSLAAESLESISPDFVLDVSHMGIISDIINSLGVSPEARNSILKCIGEKNVYGICAVCDAEGANSEGLIKLITNYGSLDKVLPILEELQTEGSSAAADQLVKIVSALEANGFRNKIQIDFSVLNDMNYYNGIVFKGFINGIPSGILSGGQYDNLMRKMGRRSNAIGFAVYLDMLERLSGDSREYDVDAIILYDGNSDLTDLCRAVSMMTETGSRVMAQKTIPDKIKYKQLLKLNEKGALTIENNA